jgi:hypothetical protein
MTSGAEKIRQNCGLIFDEDKKFSSHLRTSKLEADEYECHVSEFRARRRHSIVNLAHAFLYSLCAPPGAGFFPSSMTDNPRVTSQVVSPPLTKHDRRIDPWQLIRAIPPPSRFTLPSADHSELPIRSFVSPILGLSNKLNLYSAVRRPKQIVGGEGVQMSRHGCRPRRRHGASF